MTKYREMDERTLRELCDEREELQAAIERYERCEEDGAIAKQVYVKRCLKHRLALVNVNIRKLENFARWRNRQGRITIMEIAIANNYFYLH